VQWRGWRRRAVVAAARGRRGSRTRPAQESMMNYNPSTQFINVPSDGSGFDYGEPPILRHAYKQAQSTVIAGKFSFHDSFF